MTLAYAEPRKFVYLAFFFSFRKIELAGIRADYAAFDVTSFEKIVYPPSVECKGRVQSAPRSTTDPTALPQVVQ